MYSNDTIVLFLFLILIYLIYVNKLTTVIIFEIVCLHPHIKCQFTAWHYSLYWT